MSGSQADRLTFPLPHGVARVLSRRQLDEVPEWRQMFAGSCKDRRYYELTADTLTDGFEYEFLLIEDGSGAVRGIQPVFLVQQNICEGLSGPLRAGIDAVQRRMSRFLTIRMLMVGCSAGEGHLGSCGKDNEAFVAQSLAALLPSYARSRQASIIVFKDVPASYRMTLERLEWAGFSRAPSMPMTGLKLGYRDFDAYVATLGAATRKNLRRKLRAVDTSSPLTCSVMDDISPLIDDIYPLYLQVHERSRHKFERLTKEYFCAIGKLLPDRTRYFVWRRNEKIVAFSLCLVHGDALYDECLGMDYEVAYDLHLYYYTFRDIVRWALAQGMKNYCSTPLGYNPKRHLGCDLVPLDLYAMHTNKWLNPVFRRALNFLQPARHDPVLKMFRNADEL
jgi:predicted N-acyltransferase